jgi:hypothetical protein
MGVDRGALRAAGLIATACAVGLAVALAMLVRQTTVGRGSAPSPGADLAVVMLGHPDRLVTVDLDRLRVVSDVGLRSFPTDLVLTPGGQAVTAQAGGIGDEADDVVGVYDVRCGGPVRYVRLAYRNPGFLVTVGTKVFVEHGIVLDKGMALSVVDPVTQKVVRAGTMPDSPGCTMAASNGRIWTLELDPASLEATAPTPSGAKVRVTAVDPASLLRHPVGRSRTGVNQVVPVGPERLLVLSGRADQGVASVTEVDPGSGEDGRTVTLPLLRRGAMQGCIAGRRLVVSEWDGGYPQEGEWVTWLDSTTLARLGEVRVSGGPCAIAAWGERIVVVERRTSRLVVIDPATARIAGTVWLGHQAPVIADVAVLPGT